MYLHAEKIILINDNLNTHSPASLYKAYPKSGVVMYGDQTCEVEILHGKYKGNVYSATNLLSGSLSEDNQYEVGDIVLVAIGADDGVYKVTMVNHYRINYELFLVIAFIILLSSLSGWIGVRAILSFIFSVLCIWKVLIPLLLK